MSLNKKISLIVFIIVVISIVFYFFFSHRVSVVTPDVIKNPVVKEIIKPVQVDLSMDDKNKMLEELAKLR